MIEFYATIAFLALSFLAVLIWAIRREARDAGEMEERLRLAEDAARKSRHEAEVLSRPPRSKPDVLAILRDRAK